MHTGTLSKDRVPFIRVPDMVEVYTGYVVQLSTREVLSTGGLGVFHSSEPYSRKRPH